MTKISIDLKRGDVEDKQEVIVGIDLGTTNSLVAYMRDNTPEVVTSAEEGTALVPSVIFFDHDNEAIIGQDAKRHLVLDPSRTIFSVKRLMGRSFNDISENADFFSYEIVDTDAESLVKVKSGEKFYTPIELSALILKALKSRAEAHLKTPLNKCVITVPAYFNDSQRQATKDAGKLAGWDVLRIVNEPTAAALAYGFDNPSSQIKTVAVYDLGGGTFDMSILQLEDGVFEVLSTKGDTWLGGDDLDKTIMEYLIGKYSLPYDSWSTAEVQSFRLAVEKVKKDLAMEDQVHFNVNGVDLSLQKSEMNQAIAPIIEKTLALCNEALKDANLNVGDIDEVIMVGGSTRSPYVKERVATYFNKAVNDSINPDEVVAKGAAVQADILAGNQAGYLLLDVTPLSLGIETAGGLMDVIIPRNTKVPTSAGRNYTTSVDGQVNLKIAVYQGERDLVQDNRKLGSFILKGIPPMSAGMPKIEVAFFVDADGILVVRAKELRSNTQAEVKIHAQYGISEEQMALMLLDSIKNAENDIAQKALIEARNEGQNILLSSEKFISRHASLFSEEQLVALQEVIENLKNTMAANDKDAIHHAIQQVDVVARPLAEVAMDFTIRESLKGKSLH